MTRTVSIGDHRTPVCPVRCGRRPPPRAAAGTARCRRRRAGRRRGARAACGRRPPAPRRSARGRSAAPRPRGRPGCAPRRARDSGGSSTATWVGPARKAASATSRPKTIAEVAIVTSIRGADAPDGFDRRFDRRRPAEAADDVGAGEAAQREREQAGDREGETDRAQRLAPARRRGRRRARSRAARQASGRSAVCAAGWRRPGPARVRRT